MISEVARLELVKRDIVRDIEILMPCDVQNPMLGPNGAVAVYGPQKGAKPDDLPLLEANLEKTIRLYVDAMNPE
jgi:glycerate kinase